MCFPDLNTRQVSRKEVVNLNQKLNTFSNILSAAFAWTCAFVVCSAACLLLYSVVTAGLAQVNWTFLTEQPTDSGRSGGIAPIIVSTLLIIGVCMLATIPLGVGTAIFLADDHTGKSKLARWIRTSLDVLGGVPSIVFGLFGNAFFCLALGMGYSILSGGLTLACMVLPIFVRVAEHAIRNVAADHSRAALALALSKWTTTFQIVLPRALPGLLAAMTLGLARALAETAALIFTSGYVTRYPESLHDSGRSLSVHIYDLALNVTGGNQRAFATASVLVILLLLINAVTHFATRKLLRH